MQDRFSLINKTKSKVPNLPLLNIKNTILGKKYSLSIAFVGEKESQSINKKYRRKNKPTNVLSFTLSNGKGEIILCLSIIKEEAKSNVKGYNKNYKEWLGFLVIHGMLHLKGLDHSSTMERAEDKYDQKYFRGNRRRVVHDKGRGRRISKGRKKS